MEKNKIIINVLIRILLIIINTSFIVLASQIIENEYVFVVTNLSLILLLQLYLFTRYFIRLNSDIKLFFDAISNNDSSLLFDSKNNSLLISNYNYFLKKINEMVKEKNLEISKQKLFLEAIFNNAQVGFISFDNNGDIDAFNKSAEILLKTQKATNISQLEGTHISLPMQLKNLKPDSSIAIRISKSSDDHPDIIESKVLSFQKSVFTIDKKQISLVSFNDIKNELENNEMESWQKLIRVFTHEIMNSISPVSSLTKAIHRYLHKLDQIDNNHESKQYILKSLKGINTIEQTSNSLLNFVAQYRNLTLLPKPTFSEISIKNLFDDIVTLFSHELSEKQIQIETFIDNPDTNISIDLNMIKQVFNNLIKNSIAALQDIEDAKIQLKHFKNNKDQRIIQIIDNGKGIDKSIIDKIFVPFFTTKEKGTGIGLSLSKQILRLHSGDITVKSNPNESTVFSLIL